MVSDLHGRTALVTGASKRIGRALAIGLAREGAAVVVHYRASRDAAAELVEALRASGARAWCVGADLTSPSEIDSLVGRAAALAGEIDILVNNASEFRESTVERATRASFDASVHINAWAPFELTRQLAQQRGSGRAHVVNLLDTRAVAQLDWGHFEYCVAKSLLASLTSATALHYAPRILVNGIVPGLILPPTGKDQAYLEAKAAHVPLRRVGDPSLVVDALIYFVKNEITTGQTIFLDGGRHLLGGIDG